MRAFIMHQLPIAMHIQQVFRVYCSPTVHIHSRPSPDKKKEEKKSVVSKCLCIFESIHKMTDGICVQVTAFHFELYRYVASYRHTLAPTHTLERNNIIFTERFVATLRERVHDDKFRRKKRR